MWVKFRHSGTTSTGDRIVSYTVVFLMIGLRPDLVCPFMRSFTEFLIAILLSDSVPFLTYATLTTGRVARLGNYLAAGDFNLDPFSFCKKIAARSVYLVRLLVSA